MATPKIKVYRLDRGYTASTDTDLQSALNDELLPIVDKSQIPTDAYLLTGVTARTETLKPRGSYVEEILSNSGGPIQSGSQGNWIGTGYFLPVLLDQTLTVIPSANYTVDYIAGTVTFLNSPYPTNVTARYYIVGNSSSLDWYVDNYPMYSGLNYNYFEKIYGAASEPVYVRGDYTISFSQGLITFATMPSESLTMDFYQATTSARMFVSDHPNWLIGHMRTNPDVFVGVEDYPGDGTIGTGGTGPIPKYVDSGYAISYRDGTVEFGSTIDSVATPVRANFAYYKEIKNVTAQVLDYVGFDNGYQFKAVSETTWPGSHDKRWVTRTNSQMPNILYHTYLGTTKVIPSTLVSSPYGLAVSQSFTSLNAFETKIIDPSKNKIYFIYNGSVGQTGYLTIDGVTFSVSNVLNGSTPTLVWNGTMMSIDGVITNIATTYNFKVKYYGILCFSLYDFIQ